MTNFISGYSSGLREAVYVELNRIIQRIPSELYLGA